MLKGALVQTSREKRGTVDGINLFFGALLGANLGTLNNLSLLGYSTLIVLIGGAVMTLRLFSTSERRAYAYTMLGAYLFAVSFFLYASPRGLKGLAEADRDRMAITLGVWVFFTLLVEFYPVKEVATREPLPQDHLRQEGLSE